MTWHRQTREGIAQTLGLVVHGLGRIPLNVRQERDIEEKIA